MKIVMYTLLLWVFISFTGCSLNKEPSYYPPKFKEGACIISNDNEFITTNTWVRKIEKVGKFNYLLKINNLNFEEQSIGYIDTFTHEVKCPGSVNE